MTRTEEEILDLTPFGPQTRPIISPKYSCSLMESSEEDYQGALDVYRKLQLSPLTAEQMHILRAILSIEPDVPREDLEEVLGSKANLVSYLGLGKEEQEITLEEGLEVELANAGPVFRMANTLLSTGIADGAKRLYFTPRQNFVVVELEINNEKIETMHLPNYVYLPLMSRFKIISNLNIAERRLPQEGERKVKYRGREYDCKISTMPSKYGERLEISFRSVN